MRRSFISVLWLCSAVTFVGTCAGAESLGAFDYPNTEAARADWAPQYGSMPVRVETLDDGTSCIALDARFDGRGARATWDWVAPLDLSAGAHIALEISADNGGLAENMGVYFGTPGGWHAHFWWGGFPDDWTEHIFRLDTFGAEGEPGGWSQVERFRFSVWSIGEGEATFRLRNLRLLPADPAENYLLNGSFEIPGIGMPYGWGIGPWGIGHMPWAASMDLWRERFAVDPTVAREGRQSLRIINTAEMPTIQAVSVWTTPPESAQSLVLSAWVRADREDMPVTLRCGNQRTEATAGTEWTQIALAGVERQSNLRAIIAPGGEGTLWIDAVQLQALDEPTADFHPALEEPSLRSREQRVDWTPPNRTPEVAAGRTIDGPVEAARMRIDEHGRVLLDEQPYIQHSIGLEFIDRLEILDIVAEAGFRDVCVQIRETVSTERLAEIFDRCAEVGLRIIPWLDGRMTREQFTEHIVTLRDHPALLCWYVYDEPSGDRFAEADARYHLARELDPNRPALINYLGSTLTGHTGDIYSTDIYPIPHSSPMAAIGGVRTMHEAAAPEGKPVWMWLQATGHAYWLDREPSPRELSLMLYGSLIEGATGIYYFAQIPFTGILFDEMRALLVEVERLTPVLMSLEPEPTVTCSDSRVLLTARTHEGETWVIAVNTLPETIEARVSTPNAPGQVEVVFEDRRLEVRDDAWTDRFGPYERRVYRLTAD